MAFNWTTASPWVLVQVGCGGTTLVIVSPVVQGQQTTQIVDSVPDE